MSGIPEDARRAVLRQMLIDARRESGLTQVRLAEMLNRPQSFVSKYERGERGLDVVEFLEIADALGLDPAEFLIAFRWQFTRGTTTE